jgi:hypothetical protein
LVCDDDDDDDNNMQIHAHTCTHMYTHTYTHAKSEGKLSKFESLSILPTWSSGVDYIIDRKIPMPRQLSISFGYIMNYDCIIFAILLLYYYHSDVFIEMIIIIIKMFVFHPKYKQLIFLIFWFILYVKTFNTLSKKKK